MERRRANIERRQTAFRVELARRGSDVLSEVAAVENGDIYMYDRGVYICVCDYKKKKKALGKVIKTLCIV